MKQGLKMYVGMKMLMITHILIGSAGILSGRKGKEFDVRSFDFHH
jgi:hypothetical protein